MKLRGIEFGNILGASGVQGFFGEGYWFHKMMRPLGLNFDDVTFVSKTATLPSREGNMPLKADYTPKELFPECVKIYLRRGIVVNAVGLSNPGIEPLLNTGMWQRRTCPFFISITSLADTPKKRLEEFREIIYTIGARKDEFSAPFGLQVNLSCPNTEHNPRELINESEKVLNIAGELGVPVVPKYSIASAPMPAIFELNSHPECDALCISNAIPFSTFSDTPSPLEKFNGGGVSGSALSSMVCDRIFELRKMGFTKPINGGGGILHSSDVKKYYDAGASSVFIGSVVLLRPWRIKAIKETANTIF